MFENQTVAKYKLIEVLGRGGYGTVWEAHDSELGRSVALKLIDRPDFDAAQEARFFREAQIVSQLRHPHIVTLLEIGRHTLEHGGSVPYLAYELIEGVSLTEWCEFVEPTWREIAELLSKITLAVQHTHARGVIHRDIKPDNIIVDLAGEPHVTDFGLARRDGDQRLTEQDVTLGTIAYMSPEQAYGDASHVGPGSDIYSLGVVLYEMLTGELPFQNSSIAQYVSEMATRDARIVHRSTRKIPRDLATICLKCLEKNRLDRYTTAESLADDLERWMEGKPVKARPLSRARRIIRWSRRQPIAATLIVVLLGVSIAGPSAALHQRQLRRDAETAANQLRETNYGTNLHLAYDAWNGGRIQRTRKLLDRSLPAVGDRDLRSFAWHFLNDRVNESVQVVLSDDRPINDFAFTSDGQKVLTVGVTGTLDVLRLDTQDITATSIRLDGREQHAVATDEHRAFVGDHRNDISTVDVYDITSGQLMKTISLGTSTMVEKIDIGDNLIAIGTRYHGIHLFDRNQSPRGFIHNPDRNENVAVAPNGRLVAASVNQRRKYAIGLWNPSSQTLVAERTFQHKIYGLAWNTTSRLLAAHLANTKHTVLLSVPELEIVNKIDHGRRNANGVAFFDDGRAIVGADLNGGIFTRPIESDVSHRVEIVPHEAEVNLVKSLGGGRVASASDDGGLMISFPHAFERGGVNVLMTVGHEGRLACARDSDRFVVGDQTGKLRDQQGHVRHNFRQPITLLTWADDDKTLFCALEDGSLVRVHPSADANDWRIQLLACKHKGVVDALAQSASRGTVLAGGADAIFRCWRPEAAAPEFETYVGGRITSIVVDEQRTVAFVAGHSSHIKAIDLDTGSERFRLDSSRCTAMTLDGTSRLITGHRDGSIVVWDISTRTKEAVFRGHALRVHSLAIHSNGDELASAAEDGSVRLWSLDRQMDIGLVYLARPDWTPTDVAFGRADSSLFLRLGSRNRRSVVMRIGGARPSFDGYSVASDEFDCRENVKTTLSQDENRRVFSTDNRRDPASLGVWLDERCKGYEVRALFDLEVQQGSVQALIDHYYANYGKTGADGPWLGRSKVIEHRERITLATGWVCISEGDWYSGADRSQHSYGAIVRLSPASRVTVHGVRIEARNVR